MRSVRALAAGFAVVLVCASGAQAATPELSTTSRLQDRREVAAGQRSYVEGFQDGRFYANGWHSTGEMGGVWAPPLKLVDGVWFGIDDQWVGQATKFSSGWGYTRYDLPDTGGLHVQRTDIAPDANRAALFGLQLTNPAAADKTVTVKVDAHSELMTAYPWGFTGVTPNASDNIADQGSFTGKALQFTDDGALPGAPEHHYAALVAANQDPASGEAAATGGNFRGPQPGHVCPASDSTSPPSACDDGPFGKGTGGELRYQVTVPAGATKTLWVAVAGSDKGVAAAQSELAGALQDPAGALAAKVASRDKLSKWSQVSLPGDRLLQHAIDWGKQNLADVTQTASDLQIRWTNQGKQFPPPLGTVAHARWFGAGYPDYPWIFATDGEYTNFAAMALGQFDVAKDHLRTLRDISDILNDRSGVVVHEAVSDGSIWFGHDSQTTAADGTKTNDFNSDETIKFPSAVALIWRWTGDNGFRDEMYDFAKRNLQVVDQRLDVDHDGWPEGSGNVERPGMGPEKLDNGVYYIRSLYDLADMARSKHDRATDEVGHEARPQAPAPVRGHLVGHERPAVRGLADRPRQRAVLPEALDRPGADGGRAQPGRRGHPGRRLQPPRDDRAGRPRELVLQRRPARQPRPVPHRLRRRAGRQGRLRDLLADDLDPGRRRGQLRSPRTRPAAALHRRQRGDDVLRARHRQHARRAARRDAGDLPVGAQRRSHQGHPGQHRPLLDVPVDGHAGVGQLRDGVVGRPPAARRAPLPQRRRAAGGAAGARRPAQRGGVEHQARARVGGRVRVAFERQLHDQGRRDAHAGARARDRPHAAARLQGLGGARSTAGASSTTTRARPIAASR